MRNYVPNWKSIGISKERYLELYWFCRQYEELKRRQVTGFQVIEDCASSCGEWYDAIIQNVCCGVGYEKIPKSIMPTAYREAFFEARKEFFTQLNKRRDFQFEQYRNITK